MKALPMSVKTTNKLKFDLKTIIGPLDQKPEPKTLRQCLLEAGGFPFVARACLSGTRIATDDLGPLPVGTEVRLVRELNDDHDTFASDMPTPCGGLYCLRSNVPRWILLGHKT